VALIGGSLVPLGGQNPVEAIKLGAAVVTGPHWRNFADAYEELLASGGAVQVSDAQSLATTALLLLENAQARARIMSRAEGAIARLGGALPRTISELEQFLPPKATPTPVVKMTAQDRKRIEQVVAPVAPIVWDGRDSGNSCDGRRVATVTVGSIVDKGDHQEVAVSIFYDCGRGWLPNYRIEKVDGVWKVTGTIGYPEGVEPVGGCPTPIETSASPRPGC